MTVNMNCKRRTAHCLRSPLFESCFEIRNRGRNPNHCGWSINGLYRRYSRSELVECPKRSHQLDLRRRRFSWQSLARVQSTKVCRYVDCCVSVTVQDDSTFGVLATAKPSDLVTALARIAFCVGRIAPDRFLISFQFQRLASYQS